MLYNCTTNPHCEHDILVKIRINIKTSMISVTLNYFLNSIENLSSLSNYSKEYCVIQLVLFPPKMAETDVVFLVGLRMML